MSHPNTTENDRCVNAAIDALKQAPVRRTGLTIQRRIDLCQACIETILPEIETWMEAGAAGKGCPGETSVQAEELLTGPLIAVRLLRLLKKSFTDIQRSGFPTLPGRPIDAMVSTYRSKPMIPIFPTKILQDRLLFPGIRAHTILQAKTNSNKRHLKTLIRLQDPKVSRISAVLGAGNVSSVPFSDAIHKSLVEGQQVVLKMNPVNAYLKPIFERAFAPLFQQGLIVAIEGDNHLGSTLVNHPDIDDIHLTGSIQTHDRIVWGDTPEEQSRRKVESDPKLKKRITSELGNVTPWIVVPGKYSSRQLHSQAKHIAASITNNAGFNCLSTRVLVTCAQWPQRETFLALIRKYLDATPRRPAYYPGTVERYRRFTQTHIDLDHQGCLPWSLIESQSVDAPNDSIHFQEESFTCVCVEKTISAEQLERFLPKAVAFCNEVLPGSLCASITIPPGMKILVNSSIGRTLDALRYGCVCVNQWSGLAYSLLTPGWGGFPGATLDNARSGIDFVHNTFMLERVEKTVLTGPLVSFPKPVWFPDHRNSLQVARELIHYYHTPTTQRLLQIFRYALVGTG